MRKVEDKRVGEEVSALDEMARRGAQRTIEAALEVEVDEYVAQLRATLDDISRIDAPISERERCGPWRGVTRWAGSGWLGLEKSPRRECHDLSNDSSNG